MIVSERPSGSNSTDPISPTVFFGTFRNGTDFDIPLADIRTVDEVRATTDRCDTCPPTKLFTPDVNPATNAIILTDQYTNTNKTAERTVNNPGPASNAQSQAV